MVSRKVASLLLICLLQAATAQPVIDSSRALMDAMTTGGTYQVAPGNYWLDRNIVIATDLVLVGSGAENTVLFLTMGRAALLHTAGNLTFQDLTLGYTAPAPGDILHTSGGTVQLVGVILSGARAGAETGSAKRFGWGSAIVAWGSAEVLLSGSEVRRSGLAGIELYEQARLEIVDSAVNENNVGLYAENHAYVAVIDSRFEANMWGAYQVQGEAQSVITGSRFVANGVANEATGAEADGVRLGGSSVTRLENNRFERNPRFSVSAWGSARIEASGNVFESNGGEYDVLETYASALLLEESSAVTMHGDRFLNNPGGALELGDNATARLSEVHMQGNGSWAYIYTEDDTDLWITRSTFEGNDASIFVSGTGRFVLEESRVAGAGDDGLILDGSIEARIENSFIGNNAGVGILLYDMVNAYMAHNTVQGNRSGIVLYEGSSAVIEHNQVADNERSGIAAFEGATVEVRENEVTGNGFNGVHVDDGAQAVIEANVLRDNPRVGIGFAGQATGTVTGNHIATSAVAIAVGVEARPDLNENEFEGNGENVRNMP